MPKWKYSTLKKSSRLKVSPCILWFPKVHGLGGSNLQTNSTSIRAEPSHAMRVQSKSPITRSRFDKVNGLANLHKSQRLENLPKFWRNDIKMLFNLLMHVSVRELKQKTGGCCKTGGVSSNSKMSKMMHVSIGTSLSQLPFFPKPLQWLEGTVRWCFQILNVSLVRRVHLCVV